MNLENIHFLVIIFEQILDHKGKQYGYNSYIRGISPTPRGALELGRIVFESKKEKVSLGMQLATPIALKIYAVESDQVRTREDFALYNETDPSLVVATQREVNCGWPSAWMREDFRVEAFGEKEEDFGGALVGGKGWG